MLVRGNVRYEWDIEKNRVNLEKHKIDFSKVESFEWNTAVERRSDRFQEPRWVAIGYLGKGFRWWFSRIAVRHGV